MATAIESLRQLMAPSPLATAMMHQSSSGAQGRITIPDPAGFLFSFLLPPAPYPRTYCSSHFTYQS